MPWTTRRTTCSAGMARPVMKCASALRCASLTARPGRTMFVSTRPGHTTVRATGLLSSGLLAHGRDGEPSRCSLSEMVKDAARLAFVRLKGVARLRVEVLAELLEIHVVWSTWCVSGWRSSSSTCW
ncbi:hypothetical protein [Stigmatella aurantiaca]|uniref:hypothetical protein n=1 Tax=Stigmatella aurantiaca TaxID=41 RepID=UPI0011607478|nr:hypothetical protein [Stigmatella aurantiaca]